MKFLISVAAVMTGQASVLVWSVIEDVPLLIVPQNSISVLGQVTVAVEAAPQLLVGHQIFRFSWHMTDRANERSTLFLLYEFEQLEL